MIIRQNLNTKYAQEVRNALRLNGGFCPSCHEHNDDTKCICKEFREQISRGEIGACRCGLYAIIEVD